MAVTRFRPSPTHTLLALCLWSLTRPAAVAGGQTVRDAVWFGGSLVCLNQGGGLLAWDIRSGEFDPKLSGELSKGSFTRIASDGKRIWGAGARRLFEWSEGTRTWEAVAGFDSGGEQLEAIAVVGETPLLVYPSKVLSPTEGRAFDVPRLKGQLDLKKLRVLAVQPTDRVLWVGTGQGEWGGHLIGLDVRTGRWVQFYDALHYVTGVTVGGKEEVIVSWSMSHFGADTLIRVHKPDATPETSYPKLRDKYYQRVAYSPFDKTLYGVEGQSVVAISKGRFTAIAELGAGVFEREPMAMGVAPGVLALIPTAPETLVVVPNDSGPYLLRGRKLTRLRVP